MARRPPTPNTRKRPSRGASRNAPAPSKRRWLLPALKLMGGATVIGLMMTAVLWAEPMAHLRQITDRPIAGVAIEGEFQYLKQERVQALLADRLTDNFLQLDMEALKAYMEQDPWVDTVTVSRQWPDRLVVRIREQEPIARWGNNAFVNMRGDIIVVGDNSFLGKFPLLQGSERYAKEVMQKYVQMARVLAPLEMRLQAVRLDETLSWTLLLQGDLEVRVGRDQVFEKLQRFLDVYQRELAGKAEQIASIDLRYDNGFAVGWKDTGLEQLALADGK